MPTIEEVAHSVTPTLLELSRHKWDEQGVQVLEAANATISQDHTRWDNENTKFYQLDLRVPTLIFAEVEPHLSKIQERLEKLLQRLGVGARDEMLDTVRVLPELVPGAASAATVSPLARDVARIWKKDHVRMFVSHISAVKIEAAALKAHLLSFGVDAFVAHEDIAPTREWVADLDVALRSMDVMCALITPGFHESEWTDQEVGFALCRAIPAVFVMAGAVPYGLMGTQQALTAKLNDPAGTALGIVSALRNRDHSYGLMTQCMVTGLANARSFAAAKASAKLLKDATGLSKKQIESLLDAINANDQVKNATGVPSIIRALAKRHGVDPASRDVVTQDFDDDIPF